VRLENERSTFVSENYYQLIMGVLFPDLLLLNEIY
jgi:hypothetical protein